MTEGGPPVQPDQRRVARQQAKVTIRLIANGVARVNFDVASLRSDDESSRTTNPVALEARALTEFFPSNAGVRPERLARAVEAYSWSDPRTGHRSWILWAPDEPSGSGATGPVFTVTVRIRTRHAVIVDRDWTRRRVSVRNGAVRVSLRREDPSDVVIVAERR